MKILHILYQSLPQISGSSIRSRDILMTQKEIGLDVLAITAPFQKGADKLEIINGIQYFRTKTNNEDSISDTKKSFFNRVFRLFRIISFYREIKRLIIQEKPDIIHAHAMFFCGFPAIFLGRKFNIPVLYEVRSLWMLSKQKKKKNFISTMIERQLFTIEKYIMKKSDVVVVINENLKTTLLDEGIPALKIKLIKNAVNTTLIDHLRSKLKKPESSERLNFGYIGTLTPHEGIDLLINTFTQYNLTYPNSKLFIYGNGIESKRIKNLAKGNNSIEFFGPISPEKVHEAFQNIDVIVNPRYKNKLTDTVTPLKPLEAMAYEKVVIGSDVGGIRELITDNVNGFLFSAGDNGALEKVMIKVSNLELDYKNQIKEEALKYVVEDKSWLKNAMIYKNIYTTLLNRDKQ